MDAQQFTIVSKQREQSHLPVHPDDFLYGAGEGVDARVVVEHPTISLYCLDHDRQRALFVETPADVDLFPRQP